MTGGVRDSLALRARQGDRRALETLIDKNLDTLYGFVALKLGPRDADVEDVVQETLVGAIRSVSRLRAENDSAFLGWLLTIARYKVADHLRARTASRVDRSQDIADLEIPADADQSPPAVVEQNLRQEALRMALAQLTPEQEEVLTLKFVLGHGMDEIALITGRNIGAVRALQHRGLAALKQQLAKGEDAWTA
jgi:RNA polymerase sigma-70 factor (ECF subfamily)